MVNGRQPDNISSSLMANEMSTTGEYETFYFSLCRGDGAENSCRITSQV